VSLCSRVILSLFVFSLPSHGFLRLLRHQDKDELSQDTDLSGLHWKLDFVSSRCLGTSINGGPCECCLGEEHFLVRKCYDNAGRNKQDPTQLSGVQLSNIESPTKLRNSNAVRDE
jgi:hypothetical protein